MEKNSEKKETKYDEDGHIIVAENVKVIFGGDICLTEEVGEEEEEKDEESE